MGRPRLFQNPEQMQKIIDGYFARCDEEDKPYTIQGLCSELDVDRRTLLNYEKENNYAEFFHTVKKAKARVEENLVVRGLTGKGNPTLTIFILKNCHGYEDRQTVDVAKYNIEF